MAIFRRKLQKNERNGAFLLHIPVAVVKVSLNTAKIAAFES